MDKRLKEKGVQNKNKKLIKPLTDMRKGEEGHPSTYHVQENDDNSEIKESEAESAGQVPYYDNQHLAGYKKRNKGEGAIAKKTKHTSPVHKNTDDNLLPSESSLDSTNRINEGEAARAGAKQLIPVDREAGKNQILVLDSHDKKNNETAGKQNAQANHEDKSKLDAARNLVFLKDVSRKIDRNIYPGRMKSKDQELRQKRSSDWQDDERAPSTSSMGECAHEAQSVDSMHHDGFGVGSYIEVKHQTVVGDENFRTQYAKSYVHIPRRYPDRYYTQNYEFPDESEPSLREPYPMPQIYPANSSAKTLSNFRWTDMGEKNYWKIQPCANVSREELLNELRSVAKHEARSLGDLYGKPEEVYFQPPVSPSKHPLQYLKEAVGNSRAEQRVAEPRMRTRRAEKDVRIEMDSDADHSSFKSFNDFDEEIFKFDLNTKMYICPWDGCDKTFPSLSRIKRHYIIHTDIKPFKCLNLGCDRRFSRKDNMLQHYRVHCPFANQADKTQ